jgi:MoCo/4Fe-4S cofactor protein with predicted Tat translocation signal
MELEELSSADFKARLADEFPQGAALWEEGLSRRRFLQLMSASLALAGLNGCMRLPDEKIVPYTDQPEKVIPGRPLHFATTLQIHGHPRGVIVTSNEGRPTHIAGNPLHPLSLGAADIWTTAAVLDLYDPDRLQNVLFKQGVSTWDAFAQRATRMQAELAQTKGDGFCILTGPVNSPTELALLSQLLTEYPSARWYQHDPLSGGEPEAQLNLADTDVIFSLDSDFLFDRPDSLALIRAFSKRRKSDDGSSWNRLYVAEPCPTITGAKADHRFIIRPHELEPLAAALLDAVQGKPATDSRWPWLSAVVDDLCAHPERSVLMAGRSASFATQRMVAAANRALRSFGNTVVSLPPVWTRLLPIGTLADLASDAARGSVGTLLILDGNPVFDAPSDLRMGDWLPKIPNTIHHTLFANETSAQCEWVIHAAHDLEAWGDARGVDGTASIIQPLIAPLYDGKSAIELLSLLAGPPGGSAYELVRETWTAVSGLKEDAFEAQWHRWLRDGVVTLPVHDGPYTVVAPAFGSSVAPSGKAGPSTASPAQPVPASSAGTLDPNAIVLNLRPGAAMWDGRHANNGWLQELPDPTTKLTWDNAALLSPGTAGELEVTDGEVILLQTSTGSVEAPVLVIPGHADKCVTLALGYGRTVCGSVGTAVGVNGYPLRSSDALWHVPLEKVEKTGRTHPLARTQEHFRMEGRDLLHVARVD